MTYNKTQLNVLVNEHTHKLVIEHAKDMDIPVSTLGAWIIQTNINEVAKNRSAIIAFHQKKVQERNERWSKRMHPNEASVQQMRLPDSANQEALIQAFKDMLQPIQDDLTKLKEDLGI